MGFCIRLPGKSRLADRKIWARGGKRLFDIIVSGAGLLVAIVPMLIIAWFVRRRLGSPVLFRHHRPGLDGRQFELLKFRTMREAHDASGQPLPDSERLTPFGQWLRETSLDELPELWNIFKGDMSLVGPRPLLMDYLPFYLPDQARRNEVRPGLSGWAQVNGRNVQSWDERFAYDLFYVENISLLLDLRIVLMTVARVLRRDGVSAQGHVTMSRFDDEVRAGRARGHVPGTGSRKANHDG